MKGARHVRRFLSLQGKSLAPLILGPNYNDDNYYNNNVLKKKMQKREIQSYHQNIQNLSDVSDISAMAATLKLNDTFAISQIWKCAFIHNVDVDPRLKKNPHQNDRTWFDCDIKNMTTVAEVSVMGYSMRKLDFR